LSTIEVQFGPLTIVVKPPASPQAGGRFLVEIDGIKVKGQNMVYQLPVDKQIKVQVSYVDAEGNPAAVDDVIWSSSNDAIATVVADDVDHTQATISPTGGGPLGQVQIVATADVDLGAGVKELLTHCDVEIVAGEAVAGTITPVGEPFAS
jgi:hypothetical protein